MSCTGAIRVTVNVHTHTHTRKHPHSDFPPVTSNLCVSSHVFSVAVSVFFFAFGNLIFHFNHSDFNRKICEIKVVMIVHCQNTHFPVCSLHTSTIVAHHHFLGLGYRLQHLLHIDSVWRGPCSKDRYGKKKKYCGSFYYTRKHTCGSIQPQRRLKNILLCTTAAGSNNYFHYRFNTRLFFNYSFKSVRCQKIAPLTATDEG